MIGFDLLRLDFLIDKFQTVFFRATSHNTNNLLDHITIIDLNQFVFRTIFLE